MSQSPIQMVPESDARSAVRTLPPTATASIAVEELRDRYARLVELAPDGILIHDGEQILMANVAAARLAGTEDAGLLIGRQIGDFLHPPFFKDIQLHLVRNDWTGSPSVVPDNFRRLDGSSVEVEVTAIPFVHNGCPAAHLILRDVSERLQLQTMARLADERLKKAQAMEAIGALAGGVAHEVNNMMLVILGASDFLLRDASMADDRLQDLRDIRKAAARAATVTRQLLSYSQRAIHLATPCELDDVVQSLEQPIRRLLGTGRRLTLELGGAPVVHVDGGQVEQILINLVLNARDAMPSGGTLTIATRSMSVADGRLAFGATPIPAGEYATISVRDTGVGIATEALARMFDPFFTTKPVGQGTGLGLAAVQGILEQNGGFVSVESAVDAGTTFTLYFPMLADAAPSDPARPRPTRAVPSEPHGSFILVVDDEPAVRRVARRFLENAGYTVKLAKDGPSALETVANGQRPDLVLTDLRMPGMSGAELQRQLGLRWPALPVVFMSGYAADELQRKWGDEVSGSLIQKPFTGVELVQKVAEVLSQTDSGIQVAQPST